MRRPVVVAVVVALLVGAGATPAWASDAWFAAQALSAATISDARAAAAAAQAAVDEEQPDPEQQPVAEGSIEPGAESTVDATADLGATITFSGHEVTEPLDVVVAPLSDAASASAASELAAVVLAAPFEVTATTGGGSDVSSFPAEPTFENPDAANPVLLDVDPGVQLSVAVDPAALVGVDPASVRIVTRENEGDPWVQLPSYYDAAAGAAVAVSDHLSQFAVIGIPFVPPRGPRIVLDPDDDVGHTYMPTGPQNELSYNLQLANALAAQLDTLCLADVMITRNDINEPFVSRDFRAAQAAAWNPDIPDGSSTTSNTFTSTGRLASTTEDDVTTSFGYDGLGRNLTTTEDSWAGTVTTTQTWDGLTPVRQDSTAGGAATLMRDVSGMVALQSTAAGDTTAAPAWSLHDRLGSAIATTDTVGRVTDLADYSDFGIPTYHSTGMATAGGFTGQTTDTTAGLSSFYARSYDPFTATWLSPDTYRGTLTDPASQHRYGYVAGNPATHIDYLGNRMSDPGAYARTAKARTAGPGKPAPPSGGPSCVGTYCTTTASGSSDTTDRHPPASISGRCGGFMSFDSRPCTTADTMKPVTALQQQQAIGTALIVLGGVLLVAAGIACIVATVGICGLGIAVGGGTIAVAGAGAVSTAAVVVPAGSIIGASAAASGGLILYNATEEGPPSGNSGGGNGQSSPNQMNQQIRQGKAPTGIERVDTGKVTGEQTHVHFDDGAALNIDGSWKHGSTTITNKQAEWLVKNGWVLP